MSQLIFSAMKPNKKIVYTCVMSVGYLFTAIGCSLLFFGLLGFFDIDKFSYGLSSGARIVASIAIAGCLISATCDFILESENH